MTAESLSEVVSAGVKVGGVYVRCDTRDVVLADLRVRLENAEGLAAQAEAAGDWSRFRRCMERVHLRILQIGWLERRPGTARCWECGELDDGHALSIKCLVHRTPYLMVRAAVLAARDVDGVEP